MFEIINTELLFDLSPFLFLLIGLIDQKYAASMKK